MSGGVVCGVNSAGNIFCADSNIETSPNWTQLPGGLTHVAVNNGRLYGVNSADNTIWFAADYKNPSWVHIPGGLSQVDLG